MTLHPTELRSRMQSALEDAKIDATELARRINRSPEYVRDFLNGRKNSMKANELVLIEGWLGTEPGFLTGFGVEIPIEAAKPILRGYRGMAPPSAEKRKSERDIEFDGMAGKDGRMPILSTTEIEDSCILINRSPFEIVARPWFMKETNEGFGIVISTYAYEPFYQVNDVAFVNPRVPLIRGRAALLTANHETGSIKARLVRLVEWNDTSWSVSSFAQNTVEVVARRDWPSVLRVIGHLDG